MDDNPTKPGDPGDSEEVTPLTINADINIAVQKTNANQGSFQSVILYDGANNQHLLEGQYQAANDNVTWLSYIKTSPGGAVLIQHTIVLGPTTNVQDPNYWKMDGFMVAVTGNSLALRVRGHQISSSTQFRAEGTGLATYVLQGVWNS